MSTTYEDLLTWIEADPRVEVMERYTPEHVVVDFNVEHPGYGTFCYWLIWELTPEGALIKTVYDASPYGASERNWVLDGPSHRMGLDDFKAYVESLPKPFTAFGAVEIEEVEA